MGVIDQVFQTDYQLANQWDLFIDDDPSNMEFRVTSVTLPDYGFEMETLMSGEKIYKKLEDVEEVSITLRETPFFETYKFFADWRSQIFDFETRTFKTHTDYTHIKNITLVFYQMFPISLSPSMAASLGSAFAPGSAMTLATAANLGTNIAASAGFNIPIGRRSMSFTLTNCKIEKIEGISLDYDGKPLEFVISVKPEVIAYEYKSGPLDKVDAKIKNAKKTINNKIRSKFKWMKMN